MHARTKPHPIKIELETLLNKYIVSGDTNLLPAIKTALLKAERAKQISSSLLDFIYLQALPGL
jgi:hypothetical protein